MLWSKFDSSLTAIVSTVFSATPASGFWSASPSVLDSRFAGVVYFGYGDVGHSVYRGGWYYVRLVRAGQ